jgi:ribose transport system permease protein
VTDPTTGPGAAQSGHHPAIEEPPADEHTRVERQAIEAAEDRRVSSRSRMLNTSAGRNAGLILPVVVLAVIGFATAGDRFASTDNLLTILRLAATIGVVSVGMTFVITGGGIDLSVGAIVALASVWSTTLATQSLAADTTFLVMVFTALAVGTGCGLVNGVLIAYGRIVAFIATLAMLASARGLAEVISNRQTQVVTVQGFRDFSAPSHLASRYS